MITNMRADVSKVNKQVKCQKKWGSWRIACCGLAILLGGCGSSEGSRFSEQLEYFTLGASSMVLTAYGASTPTDNNTYVFRCPSVSGLSRDASVSVMHVRANMNLPFFTLNSSLGIRSDSASSVGVSMQELPLGMLDIYKRCQSTSSEQYVTSCPEDYTLVEDCEKTTEENTCQKMWEGTHHLVISSRIIDSDDCFSEAVDRTSYSSSVPNIAYACDSFSQMPVLATYRGTAPISGCCSEETVGPTLDFCVRPCGCRELTVQIVPKDGIVEDLSNVPSQEDKTGKVDSTLRFAVLSNVEGNTTVFRKILEDIKTHDVAFVVSLGNLTKNGRESQFREMRAIVDSVLSPVDGNDCTYTEDAQYCCTSAERQFPFFCNARINRIPFIAGLGESEGGGSGRSTYRELFGVSNMLSVIGKVEFLMIDTSDAGITSAARKWVSNLFDRRDDATCKIPAPDQSAWPSLASCFEQNGAETCHECIGVEAYCVTPNVEQNGVSAGPKNCICIPDTAKYCRYGMQCSEENGEVASCMCTRDDDCGQGGACQDGICHPPLRFVFSYTPLFDEHGLRNSAFLSRENAMALLSQLAHAGTTAIFSGRTLDYSQFSKAGIDFYLTGGGGAEMASYSSHGHHWLLVEVPNAYEAPDDYSVTVMDIE